MKGLPDQALAPLVTPPWFAIMTRRGDPAAARQLACADVAARSYDGVSSSVATAAIWVRSQRWATSW